MQHHIDTQKQYISIKNSFDPKLYQLIADHNGFIAGGAISSLFTKRKINDYDIYFPEGSGTEALNAYLDNTKNWTNEYNSNFSHTYKNKNGVALIDPLEYGKTHVIGEMKIQCINAFYGEVQDIFNTFDFHCCMGAFTFKTNEFTFDPFFLTDNMSRILRYNYDGAANPLTTLFRVEKYKSYGYTISFDELLKIIFAIKKVKVETKRDLKEFIKMLPPGIYKKILVKELFESPLDKMKIDFNTPDGKNTYNNFMDTPCNMDDVVAIICDMDSLIERDTKDEPKENNENPLIAAYKKLGAGLGGSGIAWANPKF